MNDSGQDCNMGILLRKYGIPKNAWISCRDLELPMGQCERTSTTGVWASDRPQSKVTLGENLRTITHASGRSVHAYSNHS
jgi:hypothetical protein